MEIKQFKIPKNMTESFRKDLIEQIENEVKKIKFEIVKISKSLKPDEILKSHFEDKIKELEKNLKSLKPKKESKKRKESKKAKELKESKKSDEVEEKEDSKNLVDSIKEFIS